jgi:hypothetical protein
MTIYPIEHGICFSHPVPFLHILGIASLSVCIILTCVLKTAGQGGVSDRVTALQILDGRFDIG